MNSKVDVERKWSLLALSRIQQLENAIKDRHQYIEKQWQIAQEAFNAGRVEEAEAIRKKLVEQFSQYTDLADLFREATPTPASVPKTPSAAPAVSAGSSSPEKVDSSSPPPANPPDLAAPRPSSPPPADSPTPKNDQFSLNQAQS